MFDLDTGVKILSWWNISFIGVDMILSVLSLIAILFYGLLGIIDFLASLWLLLTVTLPRAIMAIIVLKNNLSKHKVRHLMIVHVVTLIIWIITSLAMTLLATIVYAAVKEGGLAIISFILGSGFTLFIAIANVYMIF